MDEFDKEQREYIEAFQEIYEDEDSVLLIAAVTHKRTGKTHPVLLIQKDDDIVPLGILAIPGDGILDEYDFGPAKGEKSSENNVEGLDFVYSKEVELNEEKTEESENLGTKLRRFLSFRFS